MECPLCGDPLEFEEDELDEGDEFTCSECGANVRVAGVDPLELESADSDDDEDDFDDDDDDDDDEDDEEEYEEDSDEEEDWS